MGSSDKFWALLTLVIMAFIVTAVLLHASGFAQAAGTLFTGITAVGNTITSPGTAQKPK